MAQAIVTGNNSWHLNILELPAHTDSQSAITQLVASSTGKVHGVMQNCNRDTFAIHASRASDLRDFDGQAIAPIQWQIPNNIDELMHDQEIIRVLLQNQNGTIYYTANMNREAIKNTKRDGQLWVYSKTNEQLQKKGATSGDFIGVYTDSFVYGTTQDGKHVARVLVLPTTSSVCHEKDPNTGKGHRTCFFRKVAIQQ